MPCGLCVGRWRYRQREVVDKVGEKRGFSDFVLSGENQYIDFPSLFSKPLHPADKQVMFVSSLTPVISPAFLF